VYVSLVCMCLLCVCVSCVYVSLVCMCLLCVCVSCVYVSLVCVCRQARGKRRGFSPGTAARHSQSARVHANFAFFRDWT